MCWCLRARQGHNNYSTRLITSFKVEDLSRKNALLGWNETSSDTTANANQVPKRSKHTNHRGPEPLGLQLELKLFGLAVADNQGSWDDIHFNLDVPGVNKYLRKWV